MLLGAPQFMDIKKLKIILRSSFAWIQINQMTLFLRNEWIRFGDHAFAYGIWEVDASNEGWINIY